MKFEASGIPYATAVIVWGVALTASVADAGTIVPSLNDASALNTFNAPGGPVTNTAGVLTNPLTLAARITPAAADLTNSNTGGVNLIEIGGTTNGSGLLIVQGNYWFSSSFNNAAAVPSGPIDTDGSDGAIGVLIGPAVAGSQADVYASLNNANGTLVVSLNGVAVAHSLTGVGATWNWEGNGILNFLTNSTVVTSGPFGNQFGHRGGFSDDSTDGVFYTANAQTFVGIVSAPTLGQYFNATVPEPTSLWLASLAAPVVLRRRPRALERASDALSWLFGR